LSVLGILLTVMDLVVVPAVNYYTAMRGQWLHVPGVPVGLVLGMPVFSWKWGMACTTVGVIGMVLLELLGKPTKKGEP
jgi:hypothetical protein